MAAALGSGVGGWHRAGLQSSRRTPAPRTPAQRTHQLARRRSPADRRRVTGMASPRGQGTEEQRSGVARLIGTPVYTVLEVGELLVVLMLLDAAFSGDWSRIGAISKDTELALQKVSAIVLIGHLGTGAAAGWLASQKGRAPLLPAVKGFLFGALGLYEEQNSQ
ncbi:hypothetical protein Rsub_10994 [Raphidocelis subcapitata]|uniref:DUF7887 domain-containing protein n=1 Tax=Raphidocelis subcapitata TaxID=307507 RepID=A0A2V0PJ47_9CHLO|nr:hypothetical protein Rsub_10994 [Raphidocelis subcapitata]|eukprot:GBF97347.1 hypothetical protein Rsub_10994 [Raphidocelis subcapitata]